MLPGTNPQGNFSGRNDVSAGNVCDAMIITYLTVLKVEIPNICIEYLVVDI